MRRPLRWLAPVASGGAVAAYALVPALLAGHAEHPRLPAKTAAQLLAMVETAHVDGLSGTVHESADLGLPALPTGDVGGVGGSALGLLTGDHTLQVARAGTDRARVALLGQLAEQDVVVNGADVWTYDSTTGEATHATRPAGTRPEQAPTQAQVDPQAAAQQALAAIDPTTAVSVDRTAKVAGRSAYTLVLQPRTAGSLVSRVEVSVDAATGIPLRTAVYAAGQQAPAFSVAFTSISYAVPAASTFAAPDAPLASPTAHRATTGGRPLDEQAPPSVSTIGDGWTAVTKVAGLRLTADDRKQLDTVATHVAGGDLVTSRLLTVLVTPRGVAYVGAVPAATLEALAARDA